MRPEDSNRPPTVEDLTKEIDSLRKQNERLIVENERLRKELEEALRRLKRQAAPFSRGKRKEKPKRPGRKGGLEYGKQATRPIPDHIDEQIAVPLPKRCECGGRAIYDETLFQYQEDIVRKTIVRRFDVEIGHCSCCSRRVQGRHELQTSDAGRRRSADWARSLVAWMDETGWRVAAILEWLWGVVTETVTVYDILPGRGFEQASSILQRTGRDGCITTGGRSTTSF